MTNMISNVPRPAGNASMTQEGKWLGVAALGAVFGLFYWYSRTKRPVRHNPSEKKYIVVDVNRKHVLGDYDTLSDALDRMNEVRYGDTDGPVHIIGPASNRTVAIMDANGDIRMNPMRARRSRRTRRS